MKRNGYTVPTGFGDGALVPLADSLWTATTPIRLAGICFPHVMTVIQLTGGQLALHSPCRPSRTLVDEINRLGTVGHVIAPNWFHDLYLAEYRRLYRAATFWGPPMLRRRLGAIMDRDLNQEVRPPWFTDMPHLELRDVLTFGENIFFHAPTKTLILADLLANLSTGADAPRFTRVAYRLSGIDGRLAPFPYLRLFGITARRSLRMAVQQIGEWNPQRLIVGHGAPIPSNAGAPLKAALRKLAA